MAGMGCIRRASRPLALVTAFAVVLAGVLHGPVGHAHGPHADVLIAPVSHAPGSHAPVSHADVPGAQPHSIAATADTGAMPGAPSDHGRRHAGGCHGAVCWSLIAQPAGLIDGPTLPPISTIIRGAPLPGGPDLPGDPPVPKRG